MCVSHSNKESLFIVLGLADAGQEGWRQDISQGHVGNACATTSPDGRGARKSKTGTTPTK